MQQDRNENSLQISAASSNSTYLDNCVNKSNGVEIKRKQVSVEVDIINEIANKNDRSGLKKYRTEEKRKTEIRLKTADEDHYNKVVNDAIRRNGSA